MLESYKVKNWKMGEPGNMLEYLFSPCPLGLRIVNFLFQKIFRINSSVKFMVHFTSSVSGDIKIGKNVAQYMANCGGCYIQGINGIRIGDDTMVAPGVKIISANHDALDHSKHVYSSPVIIGKKCWLGTNSVILPGVSLGDNVIVGAGSVVTKSFGSNVLIAGVPAKIINSLKYKV